MPHRLIVAAEQALDHAMRYGGKGKPRRRVPTSKQIKALRAYLGLSQIRFAQAYNLSLYRVRKLESKG